MPQLTINGSLLSFQDIGTGPTILLVHGFPLDYSMWRHQIGPLSKTHRVLCPDLPGFGQSELSVDLLTMKQLADDLASLLDVLKIEKVTFCGLSMGGYIGWQFWRHHAMRLEYLIACDTRAARDSETTARGRRISALAAREHGIESLADEMIPKLFAADNLSRQSEEIGLIRTVISGTNPESVAQAQLAMAERPAATDWLSKIETRTLFIVGQHDTITPPAEMRTDCGRIRGARLVEISKAGHLSPLENPLEFNRAVLDFLG